MTNPTPTFDYTQLLTTIGIHPPIPTIQETKYLRNALRKGWTPDQLHHLATTTNHAQPPNPRSYLLSAITKRSNAAPKSPDPTGGVHDKRPPAHLTSPAVDTGPDPGFATPDITAKGLASARAALAAAATRRDAARRQGPVNDLERLQDRP